MKRPKYFVPKYLQIVREVEGGPERGQGFFEPLEIIGRDARQIGVERSGRTGGKGWREMLRHAREEYRQKVAFAGRIERLPPSHLLHMQRIGVSCLTDNKKIPIL